MGSLRVFFGEASSMISEAENTGSVSDMITSDNHNIAHFWIFIKVAEVNHDRSVQEHQTASVLRASSGHFLPGFTILLRGSSSELSPTDSIHTNTHNNQSLNTMWNLKTSVWAHLPSLDWIPVMFAAVLGDKASAQRKVDLQNKAFRDQCLN